MDVLLIEDNPDLAGNIVDYLESRGHRVDLARDGLSGLHFAASKAFDAIVLDLGLPGIDGVELCRRCERKALPPPSSCSPPVVSSMTRCSASKPGPTITSSSRCRCASSKRACVRKCAAPPGGLEQQRLQVGDLLLDERTRQVSRQGRRIALAPLDYQLLRLLMRASPAVLPRERLESLLWGMIRPTVTPCAPTSTACGW